MSGDYGRFDGVPLAYAKPIVAKPGFTYDSPSSLWGCARAMSRQGKNTQQGSSARLTVRLNPTTTLTSLTAYRTSDYLFFIDADATELVLQTSDVPDVQRQFSQEFTVVQRSSKLTWIGGAYFFDDHNEGSVEITVFPVTQIRPFAQIGTDARALFGQATYSVSTRVSVTGGVRYTDEQKDLDSTGGVYRLGTDILIDPTSFYDFVEKRDRSIVDAQTRRAGAGLTKHVWLRLGHAGLQEWRVQPRCAKAGTGGLRARVCLELRGGPEALDGWRTGPGEHRGVPQRLS